MYTGNLYIARMPDDWEPFPAPRVLLSFVLCGHACLVSLCTTQWPHVSVVDWKMVDNTMWRLWVFDGNYGNSRGAEVDLIFCEDCQSMQPKIIPI